MDRLSNMPEDILSYILSLMPTKFAVRTSILSKRWRYNWTLVTNIDIDCCDPFHGLENCCLFVDYVLKHCKSSELRLFRLRFGELWFPTSRMTKWIDEAVRLKVRELEVQSGLREFPISLFTCKTLTKLRIENRSRKVMEWHSPFNLPCLKTLSMDVFCSPSLNAFKLIRGCPILETLSLTVSYRNQPEDYIFNIPTLKHLTLELIGKCVETISKVVLNVPNLEDLFIGGQWCSQFVMEDFPSLVSVKVSFVLWIEHLWVELLKGISQAKSISFKPDFGYHGGRLPKFPNHEHLELISWYKLKWIPIFQILESCSRLEHLCIEEQNDKPIYDKESEESHWIEPKSVPTCMLMNLKTIKFEKCMGQKDDIQFLEYMLGNAKVLKTLTIMCESGVMEEEFRLCDKLLKCPRASQYCEIHFVAKSLDSASIVRFCQKQ